MRQIYLDHNATTKMEQAALNALLLFSSPDSQNYGNASSVHWAGRRVRGALDTARESVARCLGLEEPDTILFTASATESINTALKGAFFSKKRPTDNFHLLTSSVEHEATLETVKFLSELGAKCSILKVTREGELPLDEFEEKLVARSSREGDFLFVSLMVANNETGVVFPYRKIVELAKKYGAMVHLDAVQAPGKLPGFNLKDLDVDLASFSAHKIGGSKGVGALYVKQGTKLASLLHGGAQEKRRRAGSVNVAGIAAFAAAFECLPDRDYAKIKKLRDKLEQKIRESIPGVHFNGAGAAERIVNTSNFVFDGVRGESLVVGLDLEGFAVSSGSACNSGSILPSHVLLAMGHDKQSAASACRVSLGSGNTEEEVDLFLDALVRTVQRIRDPRVNLA